MNELTDLKQHDLLPPEPDEKECEYIQTQSELYSHNEFMTKIRTKIKFKIHEFIMDEDSKRKVLLIRGGQVPGVGKSVSSAITLFGTMDYVHCVFLGQNHQQIDELKEITESEVKNITSKIVNIPHKKGRGQVDEFGEPMCKFETDMDGTTMNDYNIPHNLKCELCDSEVKQECSYKKQWCSLDKASWMGVHQFLGTKYVVDSFQNVDKDHCLIMDESFLNSINNDEHHLTIPVLQQFANIIQHIQIDAKYPPMLAYCTNIINVIYSLIGIIEELKPDEEMKNIDLLKKLNEKIPNGLNNMRLELHPSNKYYNILNEEIKKRQKLMITHELQSSDWFINILPAIYGIVKIGYENLNKKCDIDINLPFYTTCKNRKDKQGVLRDYREIIYKNIDFERLRKSIPDVPIIILDATTDPKIYELFAHKIDRELEIATEIDAMIPTPSRNIVQSEDGFYYRKSFQDKSTCDKLFNFILKTILYERQMDKNSKICIVLVQKYKKMLEKFLNKNNVYDVDIFHYWSLRGLNKIKDHNVMLLLGIPEPNIFSTQKGVGMWYVGEEVISTERRPERNDRNYYYTDERLRMFVKTVRENELEQCIDRLRFVLNWEQKKKVYLITKLPISYKTQHTDIKSMQIRMNGGLTEIDMRILSELKSKGKLTANEIYNQIKGTRNDLVLRKKILVKIGCIKIEKKKMGKCRPQEIHEINFDHPRIKKLIENGYFVPNKALKPRNH